MKDHARFYSSNKEQTSDDWCVFISNGGLLYISRDKGRTYYRLNECKKLSIRFNDTELKITMINTNKLIFFEKSDYEAVKQMIKIFYP
jgi:hypothetical protein